MFSVVDKQRISEAIAKVERSTAGEIVVAVVPASAEYGLPRALAGLVWAVGSTLVIAALVPVLPTTWLVVGVVPLWVIFYALFGWKPLHRLLVPAGAAENAAQGKAFEVFARHGLHQTRDGTGILLLISELEHRVVVLGDRGINGAVKQGGWEEQVKVLVEAMRAGRAADGVLAVVDAMGSVLEQRFPRREGDTNELSDRVIDET